MAPFMEGFLVLLCLCCLLGLASAGGSIYVSPTGADSGDGTSSYPFKTINRAVSVAQSGDEILLVAGTFTVTTTVSVAGVSLGFATASGMQDVIITLPAEVQSLFKISSNAIVSMRGLSLNGGAAGTSSCILVESSTLNLSFINVQECVTFSAATGGAVTLDSTSFLIAEDCIFAQNGAVKGAAIHNSGVISIANSSFVQNKVEASSPTEAHSFGGAIYNAGSASLLGLTFSSNSAVASSASDYSSCHSFAYGGAIFNTGSVTAVGCAFFDNAARTSSYYPSELTSSSSSSYGGAIYSTGVVNMSECTFFDNIAHAYSSYSKSAVSRSDSFAYGGAIFTAGTFLATSCEFQTNNALGATKENNFRSYTTSLGGAIYNTGTVRLEALNFLDNTAVLTTGHSVADGGAIYNAAIANVELCAFQGNSGNTGGAVYNVGEIVVLSASFSSNSASSSGGAIFNAASATISNSSFLQNEAVSKYTSSYGGAITNTAVMALSNCPFANNSATSEQDTLGGAIYNTATLNASCCSFSSNGALTTVAVISHGSNTKLASGGAIYNTGETSLFECAFTDNLANAGSELGTYAFGGAIFSGGTANVEGGTFTGNMAASAATYYVNSASYGGALYLTLSSCTYLRGVHLTNNSATSFSLLIGDSFGGAIYTLGNTTVINGSLISNVARNEGGAVYSKGPLNIISSDISSNIASSGAAIFDSIGKTSLLDCVLTYNRATGDSQAYTIFTSTTGSTGKSCIFHCNIEGVAANADYPLSFSCQNCTTLRCGPTETSTTTRTTSSFSTSEIPGPHTSTSSTSTISNTGSNAIISTPTRVDSSVSSTPLDEANLSGLWALVIIPIGLVAGAVAWFLHKRSRQDPSYSTLGSEEGGSEQVEEDL